MSGSKQLLLQVYLLVGLTISALCLKNTDQTRLIADKPKPQKHSLWGYNSNTWKNKQESVPPYAVKMEPVVHYSQQDPLYPLSNISAKIDYESHVGASDIGIASNYGPPDTSYGAPYQPDYYKEPEPIIEIIIKESNESLPAPPSPPPTPATRPTKEPVQVFYVKYKKNPNSYGNKEDIIYEKPVPAITPHAETVSESETVYSTATESSPAYNYVTGPPAPSTTYRTIIQPDSEVYHGTGLKVTFGKSEASWSSPLNEAQKRDSVSESSDIQNKVKKSTDQEFKRSFVQPSPQSNDYQRNNNDFGTSQITNQPQFNGFNTPKSNIDLLQQPKKPNQQTQHVFRENNPHPNFQGQVPILNPQFKPQQNHFERIVEQRPLEFKDNIRNQQNPLQFNNQPNYQNLNNQPNIQQFTNGQNHQQFLTSPQNHQQNHQQLTTPSNHQQLTTSSNHQQFANQQNHQQFANQQNHQQLIKQQNHQQYNNPQNHQQLNNLQSHQPFNNHQNHQQIVNQQSHQQIVNQQSHQQFVNQQRPLDFQANTPLRNLGNFQERPSQVKSNNERPLITKPFENLSLQGKPFENLLPQDRPFDSRPFESRLIPDRSLENQPVFDRPFENRPPQNKPFENRYNQPSVNYRPNKPPTPQNIPLNPNPSFVPSDKRPTIPPPPPLPSNYNTQPLGAKHTVDLAFSPHQQQQQHQQFQKQQFQQQQILQQYRPVETRPPSNNNPASFVQQSIKQQQFNTEVKTSPISQYQQQSVKQQQFLPELKPSQIPQLQITPSKSFKLEPEHHPAQSGQFFETYRNNFSPTQTEQTSFRFDTSPWQVSNPPQSSIQFQPQEHREYSTTSTVTSTVDSTNKSNYKTTEKPVSYVTSQYKDRTTSTTTVTTNPTITEETKNETKKPDFKNLASLPDEVPDELREQLLSSGILSNADIQILDYDKVGDIPIENLPPEALENLYGQGSAPVPSIALPPSKSDVQMKVVKYDPATEEGRKIESTYVDRPKSQTLPPVVLNDTGYNRFLPLNINGTHFPIPDSPLLKNKAIGSVVILSPVGYDLSDDQSRPSRNTAVKVKGVHFVVGDIVKNLVKDPNRQNFETWLEKEKNTPSEEQSVVLLVTKPNGKTNGKEIYMYDVTHNQVNKLSGELSATFVDVAESNSKSNDLDNLSSEEEVDVVVSGNSTNDNTPVVSGYSKSDNFSSSIVATANN